MNAAPSFDPAGSVPLDDALVMAMDPAGARAEAIRTLRTHLMAQHLSQGRRALALCAAGSGEGCTFVAANLALAMAQVNVKTLLIDADMRHAGLVRLIPAPGSRPGLAQFLASRRMDFGEIVSSGPHPDLSVVHAGGTVANPQELLGSDRFAELMDFCLREFALTIVDTPPANHCADGRRIATVIGYALLVTRRDQTFIDDIKTLTGQLESDHARVVGAVMNQG